ncbi:MAG: hypothetical protein RLZ92_1527 [Pseudomonadota bacterium]|jgi:hypothetical protein
MTDIENLQIAFETIREVKKLLEPLPSSNTPVIAALVGAAVGGLTPIIVNAFNEGRLRNNNRNATAHQIYSEISAILTVINQRNYIESIKDIISYIQSNPSSAPHPFQVQVPNDLFHIYKANLTNLALLDPKLQSEIVVFYHYLMGLLEDIKPGGMLNTQPTLNGYNEFLQIALKTIAIGEKIQREISFEFDLA